MTIKKNILFWLFILVYLIASFSFIKEKRGSVLCSKVDVSILDSAGNKFVEESDIIEFIHNHEAQIMGSPIMEINTDKLEKLLLANPNIKGSEAFVNVNGELCVEIVQRKPIVRIIAGDGYHFYIDKDGFLMPLSDKYASHVTVANGEINCRPDVSEKINVKDLAEKKSDEILYNLYIFAKYIYESSFWRNQVEQIYVNKNGDVEIIPRVGAHQIIIGSLKDYDRKMRSLKAFYEQALNKIGWNEYETISLKFENQIVCSKR